VGKRFEAYGWQVLTVENGDTDLEGIEKAIKEAKAETGKPSLIMVQTTIGYGAPNKGGSSDMHGAPLGPDEIEATRKNLGWEEPPFVVPDEVLAQMRKEDQRAALETEWKDLLGQYKEKYPDDAKALVQLIDGELPSGWQALLPTFTADDKPEATRGLSGKCLNAVAETLTGLFGGSADLSPSTKTVLSCSGRFQKDAFENRNIHFGVREHAMGGICNGIALHNPGLIPYCATFLTFTDYMRGSIRVAALSGAPVIYVMTHDSIAVGEDGPTHQPVEHLAAMRTIPKLVVLRPADGNETSGAYKVAIENRTGPTLIALSRQKLPQLAGTSIDSVGKGAYIISGAEANPDIILIGTGGELSLCVQAAAELKKDGVNARVVSVPSFELFDQQDEAYKESVLPKAVTKRLAVEAGTDFGWQRYVGLDGATVSVDGFGTSAPGGLCLEKYGYTVENVVSRARKLLS
jgi:transketolase